MSEIETAAPPGERHAAIVPLLRARCGLAIDGLPPISWEVGRLIELPPEQQTERTIARRTFDDDDLEPLADAVAAMLAAERVARVTIEAPEGEDDYSQRVRKVARVLRAACERESIAVAAIPSTWSAATKQTADVRAVALLAHVTNGGAAISPEAAETSRELAAELGADAIDAPASEPVREKLEAFIATNAQAVAEQREAAAHEEQQSAPLGPRIAGLDPGSRYLGLVIAEGEAAPLRLVLAQTFEVGRVVPLAKPRKVKRDDGTIRVVDTKREVTDEHIDDRAVEVVELLREHGVTRLVLEHVFNAHLDSNPSKSASQATALLRQMWLATTIGTLARVAGIEVVRVAAASWRAKVAGRSGRGGEGAERIPAAIAAGFADWPETSNNHVRDAAGLALFGVLPEQSKPKRARPVRDPSMPKPKRSSAAKNKARIEAAQARRAALGCNCNGRARHARTCPAFKPIQTEAS